MFQREFDENEVDPYHGKQEEKPDTEAMDLPDELNLDQEEEQVGDEEEGEGEGEASARVTGQQGRRGTYLGSNIICLLSNTFSV